MFPEALADGRERVRWRPASSKRKEERSAVLKTESFFEDVGEDGADDDCARDACPVISRRTQIYFLIQDMGSGNVGVYKNTKLRANSRPGV